MSYRLIAQFLCCALVIAARAETEGILVEKLNSIVLSWDVNQAKIDPEERKKIQAQDVLLGGPKLEADLQKRLQSYFDQPLTAEDVVAIKKVILEYYRGQGYPIVYIEVPRQFISDGVLKMNVVDGRVGEVRSKGNKYFKSEKLISYVHLQPDDPIRAGPLIKDLEWMNRNPFRQTDLIFTPSGREGITDIELVTEDRFPWRFYVGADNTGIKESGKARWFAGFNWGDVFHSDHQFNYQFTTGNDYTEFWSHAGQYNAPLPWRHTLVLYGGFSRASGGLTFPGLATHGYSGQASLRYEVPLPPFRNMIHNVSWGFDFKRTNTNLTYFGEFFFETSVNITQLMAGYNFGWELEQFKTSLTIEAFGSPGEWIGDQSNRLYRELRAGAQNEYIYMRGAFAPRWRLPKDFTIEPTFRCQFSSANLLSSEQFGLGGYDTVRGYNERQVNVDNMLLFNLELRTCKIRLLGRKNKKIDDELKFLGFFDWARGWNHLQSPGEPEYQYLMGIGPGIRYFIHPYLTIRFDLAYRLHQLVPDIDRKSWMSYYGMTASY